MKSDDHKSIKRGIMARMTSIRWLMAILLMGFIKFISAQACSCRNYETITSWTATESLSCTQCEGPAQLFCHLSQNETVTTSMIGTVVRVFSCQKCTDYCVICTGPSFCDTCIAIYYPQFGICLKCSRSPHLGSKCNTCNRTHCHTCSSGGAKQLSLTNFIFIQLPLHVSPARSFLNALLALTESIALPVTLVTLFATQTVTFTFYQAAHLCTACGDAIPECTQCQNGIKCNLCKVGFCTDLNAPNWDCVAASSFMQFCKTCDNGLICTSCQESNAFDLNQVPKTCVPCTNILNCKLCSDGPICTTCQDGFAIDSATKLCTPCSKIYKCDLCNNGPVSTKCLPGFYIDATNQQCFPCQFPCVQCSVASTNCTKCPLSQLYYLVTPTSGNCNLCNVTLQNCVRCNADGTICEECVPKISYLEAGKCVNCSAPCLQCISKTECLSCTDSTTLLVEGLTPGTFLCKDCSQLMANCEYCLQPNVCEACQTTGGPFFLTFPPNACWECGKILPNSTSCNAGAPGQTPACNQCVDKFYLSMDECFSCPHACNLCTNQTSCTSCIATGAFILDNSMCVFCGQILENCLECSDSTTCLKCKTQFILSFGTCISCNSLYFPNKINSICDPCVSPCKTCLTADDCLTCAEFYEYVNATQKCIDNCGDTFVVTDECDNGRGIFHDGCNDQCKQEPNYTCRNDTLLLSGQSVAKSTCSYDLKPNISLFSAQKEPFRNTMTLTYLIVPYLFGLPGTTLRSFTQDELKKIFVLFEETKTRLLATSSTSGINVESVAVDSNNSKVTITFSYEKNIRESDMGLTLDVQYLKTSLGLPYFATTPDSEHVFQLSSFQPQSKLGQFYTDEQYSQAIFLNKVATAIGILSFLAFLIGIFTKEVAGLEMAMLCQFAYVSLFFFEGPLQLPFFALKSLGYSTGYNLPLSDMNFKVLDQNPPQSFTLGFDPRTFWNNFNFMAILYVLPLVAVIPFIPLKAKCVRKKSMIELGNKWVDLLLGEIILFCTLFNFQYLMFGLIAFYRDERDVTNYASSTVLSLGLFCTVCSFLGFIFKPEIYGSFRTAFRYDTELRKEIIEERARNKECEEHILKKFKDESKCEAFKALILKWKLFVNENYFWRNYRRAHTLLTYNHYNFMLLYFSLMILGMNLIRESEIVLMVVSGILLVDLILMRPYCEVSEKLRGIYFALIYIGISLVSFYDKAAGDREQKQNMLFGFLICMMLGTALIWTYLSLGFYFYRFWSETYTDKEQITNKVFKQTDFYDQKEAAKQEDVVMKNLMKRYERVELQYNVDSARTDFIVNYNFMRNKVKDNILKKDQTIYDPLNQIIGQNNGLVTASTAIEQIISQAQEDKFYKNLKDDLKKLHRKKNKEHMKGTVSGEKMLNFLKLNNFSKYQNAFLGDEAKKIDQEQYQSSASQKSESISSQKYKSINESTEVQSSKKVNDDQNYKKSSSIQSSREEEEYESIDPRNLEEAQRKIEEERILIDENQFIRYKRAMKLISKEGLILNQKLIASRYDHI